MKIYDLSPEISENMAVYKNQAERRPKFRVTRTLKQGANESKLDIFVHTGSHVDAPYHVLSNGKTIDKIDLNKFMGQCVVLDFTQIKYSITKKHLIKFKVKKNQLVIVKKNTPHRVIAKNKVEFLEISEGKFNENDEKRLEDKYGRS